jgi:hypothetical protein
MRWHRRHRPHCRRVLRYHYQLHLHSVHVVGITTQAIVGASRIAGAAAVLQHLLHLQCYCRCPCRCHRRHCHYRYCHDVYQPALQGKVGAKVPAKSSNLNFEGYFLEFVVLRMEIWYKLKYPHSWFGTRKNMHQRMYHFIILTYVTNLLNGYF